MRILPINTKTKNYNIYIGQNILSKFNIILKKKKFHLKNL